MSKLSIIIPCYFNELNLPNTTRQLLDNESLFPEGTSFEYVMVDDGSGDGTYAALLRFQAAYPTKVRVVKLVSNVGSYNAIAAGMRYATGDCCTVISADLQDPPEVMAKMFDYWQKGLKLVIANRQDREDAWTDKLFSNTFQRLIRRYGLKNLPAGGFDFVLFDAVLRRQVVDMQEKNTNTLYLLLWLGYDYVSIPYTRRKRDAGKSRWTLGKKIKLLIDSFVAFSYWPIRAISVTGIVLGIGSFFYAMFLIVNKLFGFVQVEGWTTMMVVMVLLGAFQMTALGIIGEYVWRTLDATRRRPSYVVEEVTG
jgi:polyisoprenyl-phosphate glycosyltransferase